jgi:hypothetical protein
MKASAAFETKAWRTDAEGRCCKDRPDKGGENKTATGKTGTSGTCNQEPLRLLQTPFAGSGMPHHVGGVLLHTMSGSELSHVRTEL